jgi:hypothetical protein
MFNLGDLVLLDFPYTNRAGSKVRPGVVIAIGDDRFAGDLQVAYLTSEVDTYRCAPHAISISQANLAEGRLKLDSVARVDKVITVHQSQCRKVARLNAAKRDELLRKATAHRVRHYADHHFEPTDFLPGQTPVPAAGKVLDAAAGFPTTVNPILQYGAIPVFVDVELGTYNIDVSQLEEAIGPRTKAILLAHTLGNPGGQGPSPRRHLRRPRHPELLPRPPHHHGRGRCRLHQPRPPQTHRRILSRLGPRLFLRAGQGRYL